MSRVSNGRAASPKEGGSSGSRKITHRASNDPEALSLLAGARREWPDENLRKRNANEKTPGKEDREVRGGCGKIFRCLAVIVGFAWEGEGVSAIKGLRGKGRL